MSVLAALLMTALRRGTFEGVPKSQFFFWDHAVVADIDWFWQSRFEVQSVDFQMEWRFSCAASELVIHHAERMEIGLFFPTLANTHGGIDVGPLNSRARSECKTLIGEDRRSNLRSPSDAFNHFS